MTKEFGEFGKNNEQKEHLEHVEISVRGSELAVVGDVDYETKIITNARIEHRSGSYVPERTDNVQELEDNKTVWSVDSDKDYWQIHLDGFKPGEVACDNVDVKRNDGTQWHYTLTDGQGPDYPAVDLVFSRAQGYMAPIFRPQKGDTEVNGKRLIAVEPLSAADYVGVVAPAFKYNSEKGIEIVVQNAKHTAPDLTPVATIRAVRASVDKPDYKDVVAFKGATRVPLNEVDLHPDLIASAPGGQKMRVKMFGIEYESSTGLPEGQTVVPLKEYLDSSADGVGLSGFYQLFTEKFQDHLSTHEEGMNNETADYPVDPEESYGKPIRVGLIKGKNTWRVIYRDDAQGKFGRDGNAIQAKVGRNFEPESVRDSEFNVVDALQVHKLQPVNPNNARETGTYNLAGLHPVEVYVYEQSTATANITSETLCDFAKSGDGPAQMALMEWLGHTYGDVFNNVLAEQYKNI